jgi:hypothetical protein
MGAEQARLGSQTSVLAGLGMLQLIEEHGGHKHRIDVLASGFGQDHRVELHNLFEGVGPQRLQTVEPLGKKLGKLRLRTVNAEASVEGPELFGAEVDWIRPQAFRG